MKKTFEELNEIDSIVGSLYKASPELKETKFGYAYKRFSEKNYTPTLKEFQEALADVRIDNALTDEKTQALLTDQDNVRGFKYSKDGLKAVIKAENELVKKFNAKEIEVEPFISAFVPELTEEQKEKLEGLVI